MNYRRLLIFDVETYETMSPAVRQRVRNEAFLERPAQSVARDEKLRWDEPEQQQARMAEALSATALDVVLAEPLVVAFAGHDAGDELELVQSVQMHTAGVVTALNDPTVSEDYKAKLFREYQRQGMAVLREELNALIGPGTVMVGHNIAGYDLAVLCNTWRRLRIAPPEHFPRWTGHGWQGRVFDTMKRIPTKTGFIGLERACEAYGVGHAFGERWRGEEVDGSKVGAMFRAGDLEALRAYCADDVRAEFALYMAITCGDRCDTYDRHDAVVASVREIRAAGFGVETEKLAIYGVMERAGLVPR